jgi:hypothetical protein
VVNIAIKHRWRSGIHLRPNVFAVWSGAFLIFTLLFCGSRPLAAQTSLPKATADSPIQIRLTQIQDQETDYSKFRVYFSLVDANGKPVSPAQSGISIRPQPQRVIKPIGEIKSLNGVSPILVLDCSGSMEERDKKTGRTKMDALKSSLRLFLKKLDHSKDSKDQCAIILLGSKVPQSGGKHIKKGDYVWILGGGWMKPDEAEAQISNLTSEGVTPLYDAIYAALEFREQEGKDRRTPIVVMTDGFNNLWTHNVDPRTKLEKTSVQKGTLQYADGLNKVLDRAKKSNVVINTIGFGVPGNPRPNEEDRANDKDRAARDRYWSAAAKFLDVDALNRIASATGDGNKALIAASDAELTDKFTTLINQYKSEWYLDCQGAGGGVVHNPAVSVEIVKDGKILARSTPMNRGFIVMPRPIPLSPAYGPFVARRLLAFGITMALLIALWFAPMFLKQLYGPPATLTRKEDLMQRERRPMPPQQPNPYGPPPSANPYDPYGQNAPPMPQGPPYPGVPVQNAPMGGVPQPPPAAYPSAPSSGSRIRVVEDSTYSEEDAQRARNSAPPGGGPPSGSGGGY